jgi:hypothetical protein
MGIGYGGGVYNSSPSMLTVSDSTLSNNSALYGGGICNDGALTVSNSILSGNTASSSSFGYGGGVYNSSPSMLTVSDSTLSNNSALYGGGIENGGTATVSNSTLSGNSATGTYEGGGGIDNNGYLAMLAVSNSTLSGNSARSYAGGIGNVYGTVTVSNSTLSGNSAISDGGGTGGGIDNGYLGTLTVSNSTLSDNSAREAGCILNASTGTLTVNNSTLSGNTATDGGGINNRGTLTVNNSTLSGNTANDHGGGLYVYSGSPVLHNTLIAGNFRGPTGTIADDVYGRLDASGDYNLIGDGTGLTGLSNGVNGNLVGSAAAPIDPLLGPLQDNGSPTQTHALLAGSPALDAGDPTQLGVADQRGVLRTGGVNIGAYQASATAFVLSAPDTVDPGAPFDLTVAAVDPFGQPTYGYTGTVTFTTTDPDPGVVLPADYSFTPDDQGTHTFSGGVTLVTPGDQTITATDTSDTTVAGCATVTVTGGPYRAAAGIDALAAAAAPAGDRRAADAGPALAAGFFEDPDQLAHWKRDADLAPLWPREDFRPFIAALAAAMPAT